MTDPGRRDDVLEELRADLASVRPSPEFAAGVRERIARGVTGRSLALWCAPIGVVAAAVMAMVIVNPPPADRVASPAVPVPAAIGSEMSTPVGGDLAVPPPDVRTSMPAARRNVRTASLPVAESHVAPDSIPDFEVITNQAAVLAGLWRAFGSEREPAVLSTSDAPVPSVEREANGSIVVPELSVSPVLVVPIGEVSGGGQGPAQRRVYRVVSPEATRSPQ